MNQAYREMIAWWQKNDRVTLSIAASDTERLEWAKEYTELPWQIVTAGDWSQCKHPSWHSECTYRIDPAYLVPEEPASPWDEVEVRQDRDNHLFRYGDTWTMLYAAPGIPGYGGILWRDEQSGIEDWSFHPIGIRYIEVSTVEICSDPGKWIRPCHPVKVRFWRGV